VKVIIWPTRDSDQRPSLLRIHELVARRFKGQMKPWKRQMFHRSTLRRVTRYTDDMIPRHVFKVHVGRSSKMNEISICNCIYI